MKKLVWVYIVLYIFLTGCISNHKKNQINNGNQFQKLNDVKGFESFFEESGALIGEFDGKEYAVGVYADSINRIIILEEITNDSNGQAWYIAIDTIHIDQIVENQYIYLLSCRKNSVIDKNLIVLGNYEDKEYLTDIVKTWFVDLPNKEIIEVKSDGIDCINEGWGI